MHAQRSPFFIISHGLNHAAEDIWIDVLPIQATRTHEVGTRHAAETRHFGTAGEKTAIDVRKTIYPIRQLGGATISSLDIHRAENEFDHFVRVGAISLAH